MHDTCVCRGCVCVQGVHVCAGGAFVCRGCMCVQGVHARYMCVHDACVCRGCIMIAASAFRTQHAHSCKHVLHRILALH